MTEQLAEQTCVPCRGGIPPLEPDAARQLLQQTPDWTLLDEGKLLQRTFRFGNFRASLDFVRAPANSPKPNVTIPTSLSVGVTPQSRCGPKRSKVCTRTISSWRRSSTALHERAALRIHTANSRADQGLR